jgi:hypothetical protein
MPTQLPLIVYEKTQKSNRRRTCDLPAEERPLYRLDQVGTGGLATTELLALILGTAEAPGLAQTLDDGAGQGFSAWRVLPASDAWQEVIQSGLQGNQITF